MTQNLYIVTGPNQTPVTYLDQLLYQACEVLMCDPSATPPAVLELQSVLKQPFQRFGFCPAADPIVTGTTHTVTSEAEVTALNNSGIVASNDRIRITQTYTGKFNWDSNIGGGQSPAEITASPGVVLNSAGFDVMNLNNMTGTAVNNITIDASGQNIGNSGPWTLGIIGCDGITIQNSQILNFDTAGIAVRGNSNNTTIECSTIDGGVIRDPAVGGEPWFNEGIYIGTAGEVDDFSDNTVITRNVIQNVGAEAVEVKTQATSPTISYNYINNIRLHALLVGGSVPTGAITLWPWGPAGAPAGTPQMNAAVVGNVLHGISHNPAWAGPSGSYDRAPITVHYGGATIESNIVFDYSKFAAVELRSFVTGNAATQFGPDPIIIRGNTSGQPDGAGGYRPVVGNTDGATITATSNIPDQAGGVFVGPETGTADAGDGPGSGFALQLGSGGLGAGTHLDATGSPANTPPDQGALQIPDLTIEAGCSCATETVTFWQDVAGVFVDKTGQWELVAGTTYKYAPTEPATQAPTTTWRYCCGTVCTTPFTVNLS